MKPAEFSQHWNLQATFCPSPQCFSVLYIRLKFRSQLKLLPQIMCLITLTIHSLCHMKITASATKSLHQDHGLCYLHLPNMQSHFLLENKKVVVTTVFLRKLDHRPLFNNDYTCVRIGFYVINTMLVKIG